MARPRSIIMLNNISFGYDTNSPIFHEFSMSILHKERVAILGKSGEGKSTLVNIMAGYIQPWNGEIIVDGSRKSPAPKVTVMSQENDIFDWLTVQQNMELVSKDKKRNDYFLKAVGLDADISRRGHMLSTGMKKRLSFARALSFGSDVLILDEPFSSLDYPRRQKLYAELLKVSKETDTAVVLVTHDIHEAVSLCDKIYLMSGKPVHLQEVMNRNKSHPDIERHIKKMLE